jgi:hypothetical protein
MIWYYINDIISSNVCPNSQYPTTALDSKIYQFTAAVNCISSNFQNFPANFKLVSKFHIYIWDLHIFWWTDGRKIAKMEPIYAEWLLLMLLLIMNNIRLEPLSEGLQRFDHIWTS